ncbi:MAG: gas vesicle protein K, partial [Sphaerobacteraceae bacterium]
MTRHGQHDTFLDIDDAELEELAAELESVRVRTAHNSLSSDTHINADENNVEQGLAKLVLSLVELLRQLLERQALRRMERGTLDDEEIERLGTTFMKLQERIHELQTAFGLEDEDLNIDLGPLGKLLDDQRTRAS